MPATPLRFWIVSKGCYQWTHIPSGEAIKCPTCGIYVAWEEVRASRMWLGVCGPRCEYQHIVIMPPKPMPTA